ncbi:MAG: ribokinase [Gaiellaceae bacterium]
MAHGSSGGTTPAICVVGAGLIDLISYVPRLPRLGQTLHGSDFQMGFGGKGANQAVLAAKLGARVSMVTKLGRDLFGENMLANFDSLGIDTTHVSIADGVSSGVAPIAVDANGDNAIIIVTGANAVMTTDDIERARPAIATAGVLVCQLQIELEITQAALEVAREESTRTILNPAPAVDDLPADLFELAGVLCSSEPETELLLGRPIGPGEELEAAHELLCRGARAVVLTLGARGCVVVSASERIHLPVEVVEPQDTTGAGDAFVGSLAYFLARGEPLTTAAERANRIAAVSVQARGTQTSFPSASELPAELLA